MSIGTVGPGNPLSLNNIRFELSRNNTISLNDTDVRNFSTKPVLGSQISALDFQNKAGVLDLGTLPSGPDPKATVFLIDAQLRALAINQGWNGINPFKLTIPSNYVLGASSYSLASGLTISGDFAAGTVVTNYGKIVGRGGTGAGGVRGQAGSGGQPSAYFEPAATAGGTAINASGVSPGSAGNLQIVNYGTIAGGGGGGGGGDLGNFNSPINNGVGGSGGGGGAGWYVGQGGPKAWPFYTWLYDGSNGTLDLGGAGGAGGSQSGYGIDKWGGGGGTGGNLGQAGAIGQSTGWQGGSSGGKPGLAILGIDKIIVDPLYNVIGKRGLSSNQDQANAPVSQGFLETTSTTTYNSAGTNYYVYDYLTATPITDTNKYSDTNTLNNYAHRAVKATSGPYNGYSDDDITGPMYSDGDGISWHWPWAFKLGGRATRHRYNTSIFAFHNFWAHTNSWFALMENIEAAKYAKNDSNYNSNGTSPPLNVPHIAIGAGDYVPTFMGFQAWGPAYGDIIYQRYLYKGILYGVPFPTPTYDSQRFEYEVIFWPPTTVPNCQVFEVHVSQYGPNAGRVSQIGGLSNGVVLDLSPYVVANNTFVCVGDSDGLNWKVYNNTRIRTGRPFYT